MAKSMRSKKEKRLRAIRRELVQPMYDNKDVAKYAAQEAALAAPKLPVKSSAAAAAAIASVPDNGMDIEMADGNGKFLKPIGKKMKKKIKIARKNFRGKGKIRKKPNV